MRPYLWIGQFEKFEGVMTPPTCLDPPSAVTTTVPHNFFTNRKYLTQTYSAILLQLTLN